MLKSSFKKSTAVILTIIVLLSSFSPIFARKAQAFIIVDWVNFAVNSITAFANNSLFVKEYALDAVAYQVTNMVIERISASTVKWINSGFKGSPAYIENPEDYFQDLGDKIAGDFIANDPGLSRLCGPISLQVRLALTSSYTREQEWQCTLSDVKGNFEDFMGDFSRGGWDNFFEVTQKPQNNPIGAYLQAQNELSLRLSSAQESKKMELQWGTGFLSKKECVDWSDPIETEYDYDDDGNLIENPRTIPPECINEKTSTPGSVIEEQLNGVLGIGTRKLEVADEINEILSSLINQLTNRVIGGIGSGLKGLSTPDSQGNKFTDQLTSEQKEQQINEYFQDSEDNVNNILNLPPPDPNACRNNPSLPECLPPPGDPNNSENGSVYIPTDPCITNPSDPSCQPQP